VGDILFPIYDRPILVWVVPIFDRPNLVWVVLGDFVFPISYRLIFVCVFFYVFLFWNNWIYVRYWDIFSSKGMGRFLFPISDRSTLISVLESPNFDLSQFSDDVNHHHYFNYHHYYFSLFMKVNHHHHHFSQFLEVYHHHHHLALFLSLWYVALIIIFLLCFSLSDMLVCIWYVRTMTLLFNYIIF